MSEDTVQTVVDLPAEGLEKPRQVLVAEDEHLIAMEMAENLQDLGYEVLGPVANGAAAINLTKVTRPDLALLDIRMPEMDGLAAASVLFCQMGIPVVILSAYSDPEYIEAATRIGVFGYVLKPATRKVLEVNIAIAWARYRQHSKLRQKVSDLQVTIDERKVIETAKGLLMEHLGLSEAEALNRLRRKARDSRRKMADLARAIIETRELLKE